MQVLVVVLHGSLPRVQMRKQMMQEAGSDHGLITRLIGFECGGRTGFGLVRGFRKF